MEDIELRKINLDDEQPHKAFIEEYISAGEEAIPANAFPGELKYPEWFNRIENLSLGKDLPEGWVPSSIYFLFCKNKGKIIGAIDIRHDLNDFLLKYGGNIGYSIVPSERRKGYANEMLRMALEICKEKGMKKILLVCNKKNIASAKTILRHNGVLENETTNNQGAVIQRYWVLLGDA